MRLINNTKGTSRIGFVCKIDPSNPASFIYATANDTQVLGICAEAVPYRSECEVITNGVARVFVSGNVVRGAVIRNRKGSDTISNGMCAVAKGGDAPYLQIGYATESGKGLIKCNLLFNYTFADSDSEVIDWDQIGNPSVRIVTDTTTELTTDYTIVCNKVTALTVNLLAATGSGRIRNISNINTGSATVTPSCTDTIDGETSQSVSQWENMVIQDYLTGKWKII